MAFELTHCSGRSSEPAPSAAGALGDFELVTELLRSMAQERREQAALHARIADKLGELEALVSQAQETATDVVEVEEEDDDDHTGTVWSMMADVDEKLVEVYQAYRTLVDTLIGAPSDQDEG